MAFTAFEKLAKRVYVDVAFDEFSTAGQEALDLARLDPVGVDAQGRAATSRRARRALPRPLMRTTTVLRACSPGGSAMPSLLMPQPSPPPARSRRRTRVCGACAPLQRRHASACCARRTAARGRRAAPGGRAHRIAHPRLCPECTATTKSCTSWAPDVADLVATIDHNLQHGGSDARFQRKVMYRGIAPTGTAGLPQAQRRTGAGAARAARPLAGSATRVAAPSRSGQRARTRGPGHLLLRADARATRSLSGSRLMKIRTLALIAMAAGLQWLAGCGGGGDDAGGGIGGTGSPLGTLRMSLTDAPACGYDAVNITVERIRVHQSDGAADNDSGWHDIVAATRPTRRPAVADERCVARTGRSGAAGRQVHAAAPGAGRQMAVPRRWPIRSCLRAAARRLWTRRARSSRG